jgi:hypothetical protein
MDKNKISVMKNLNTEMSNLEMVALTERFASINGKTKNFTVNKADPTSATSISSEAGLEYGFGKTMHDDSGECPPAPEIIKIFIYGCWGTRIELEAPSFGKISATFDGDKFVYFKNCSEWEIRAILYRLIFEGIWSGSYPWEYQEDPMGYLEA